MNGLVLIDKPQGYTSFKTVTAVKRIFGTKRVGHTGTLDPMATGVLPVLVGKATRLSGLVLEADKRYTATVRLGITTDSLDITGNVLKEIAVNVSDGELFDALRKFTCSYMQTPPMFSAIKVNGKRLYALARNGVEVEREARQVTIKEMTLLGRENDEFTVDVLCSKGTYIRSLADDIGRHLGCGAVLTSLRRTMTAQFDISECVTLEELEKAPSKYLYPAERAVEHLPFTELSCGQARRFINGAGLAADRVPGCRDIADGQTVRMKYNGNLLGLAVLKKDENELLSECVIADDL